MSTTTGFDLSQLTELVNETDLRSDFWMESVLSNDTFAFVNQYGTVYTGLKNDHYKLPTMDVTATLKDGSSCGFTPTDQATPDQTDLYMASITVQGQFCVRELEPYVLGLDLPAGQHYTGFNPLEQAILNRLAEQVAKKLAIFPYYGPTGSDTISYSYDWATLLEGASGTFFGNSGTPAAITNGGTDGTTATGVFNVVEAILDEFYGDPDTAADANGGNIICSMSPNAARLYFQNYRTLHGGNNVNMTPVATQLAQGRYSAWQHDGTGVTIVTQNALGTEDQIIVQKKGNQTLAFDLTSDATRIEMGMDQYREYIWWKVRVKMGSAWRSTAASSVRWFGAAS